MPNILTTLVTGENKETRTIVEWKQIRCSIKKYKSGGKVGGVRNMLRAGKKDEGGWERTWRWSQMRLSISPLSYNGSFPQGANWIQTRSDRKTTPSQPLLHSCLCLHPLLCGHAPSLSPASSLVIFTVFLPAPEVLNMSECLGNEVNRNPNPERKGREGTLAVSTSRKSENTGRGDAVARAFLLV